MSDINKYYPEIKQEEKAKEITAIDFTKAYIIIYTKNHGIFLKVREPIWDSNNLTEYDLSPEVVSWPTLNFSIRADSL